MVNFVFLEAADVELVVAADGFEGDDFLVQRAVFVPQPHEFFPQLPFVVSHHVPLRTCSGRADVCGCPPRRVLRFFPNSATA